jgi:hypothetical protein
MPFIERRSPLTATNARAADNASRMVRVQGIQGILYSHLVQGRACTCKSTNHEVAKLSADGKADTGTINRVLTGNQNFGVSDYDTSPEDDFEFLDDGPTSPNNAFNKWLSHSQGSTKNNPSDDPTVGDDGQSSPDLDDLMGDFDIGSIGYSDVSCPICFGSGYVGGFSMTRGFRRVIIPSEMTTASTLDLPSFALLPGTHTVPLTLPLGATKLDVFRAFNGTDVVPVIFKIDGQPMKGKNPLKFCDGRPHILTIESTYPLTHVEIQFATSDESLYFEIPRISRSSDLSFLEQQEPFQIIVSPDVPVLKSLDVISESQRGKLLIVQTVNEWNTRSRNMLGHEITVRVAQPQELYRILPVRSKVTAVRPISQTRPAKTRSISGVSNDSFTF